MDGLAAPLRLPLPGRRLGTASDERLVAQIRGRDAAAARSAFEALYDRHHRGILAYCRQLLGSQEEAEDVVQHTFSAAYRALLRDDRVMSVRAWLYTIARNRCLSVLSARCEQVDLQSVEQVLPGRVGLAAEVEQRADLRELLADLQRLPEQQRSALVLSELEAHSHTEIAEILGVRPAKVKALVFQARETLMICRQAREADCTQVREQLSVLRGSSLRRRELRRHVETCAGCQAFEVEVRRQRAGMALLLPVAPTLALKQMSLGAAFAAGGTGAAAGTGAFGGGALAVGGLSLGVKTVGAKTLAALAVAAGTGGGGYVAVNEITREASPARQAQVQPAASSSPESALAGVSAAGAGASVTGDLPVSARERARTGRPGGPNAHSSAGAGRARARGTKAGAGVGGPGKAAAAAKAKAKANAKASFGGGPGSGSNQANAPKAGAGAQSAPGGGGPKAGAADKRSGSGSGPAATSDAPSAPVLGVGPLDRR